MKYNKDKVERHKLEVQGILATLNTPGPPADPYGTAITSVSENGMRSHQPRLRSPYKVLMPT